MELIQKLSSFDPEAIVVTRGFDEEGFADIQTVKSKYVQQRKSESARQTLGEYELPQSTGKPIEAVLVDHS